VVTWELLTWRRPWDELVNDPKFISWRARQRIEEGSARLTLPAVLAVEKPELATLLSRCLDLIPENRPTAEEVVQVRANFSTSHPHHHHTSWSHRMKFAQYWSLHDSDILTDLVIASVQLSTRSITKVHELETLLSLHILGKLLVLHCAIDIIHKL
jgi:serine/threonine protein kinase